MPGQEAGIDADPAVEAIQPLPERRPVPLQRRLQRGQWDPLHLRHQAGQVVGVGGAGWGQAETAVAADHGRRPVEGGGSGGRVPIELGVVVRVKVNETRSDHATGGVDGPARRLTRSVGRPGHRYHFPVLNTYVTANLGWPEPSRMVPPEMSRSSTGRVLLATLAQVAFWPLR